MPCANFDVHIDTTFPTYRKRLLSRVSALLFHYGRDVHLYGLQIGTGCGNGQHIGIDTRSHRVQQKLHV